MEFTFKGHLVDETKSGGTGYSVICEDLQLATQGETLKECEDMVKDAIALLADCESCVEEKIGFKMLNATHFEVSFPADSNSFAFVSQRLRQRAGLSLSQSAKKMGQSSKTAMARYESKSSSVSPSVDKMGEIFSALDCEVSIRIRSNPVQSNSKTLS